MLLFTPELPSHSWPHRCELRLASLESWERGKEGFFPEGRTGNSWRARPGLAGQVFFFLFKLFIVYLAALETKSEPSPSFHPHAQNSIIRERERCPHFTGRSMHLLALLRHTAPLFQNKTELDCPCSCSSAVRGQGAGPGVLLAPQIP